VIRHYREYMDRPPLAMPEQDRIAHDPTFADVQFGSCMKPEGQPGTHHPRVAAHALNNSLSRSARSTSGFMPSSWARRSPSSSNAVAFARSLGV